MTPVAEFVRNGQYLRTVCRKCWAESNRITQNEQPQSDGIPLDKWISLNKLWRPVGNKP